MKALLSTLTVVFLAGCSSYASEPISKRAPNGGHHLYSHHHAGKGTVENGCILSWDKAGHETLGYNPKRVEIGDITTFTDCSIEPKRKVAPAPEVVAPSAPPVCTPCTPAPHVYTPAPAPAWTPVEQPKPVKE